MVFSQKWIADAVSGLMDKSADDITAEDIKSIKYLAFGESFDNSFFIELSAEEPPKPFVNCDGGDEWEFCLRGDDISKLVDEYKGRNDVQLSNFGLEREDAKWSKYVSSREAEKLWEAFSKTVKSAEHYEEFSDDDEFEEWYDGIRESAWRDAPLFTGVEVLRIQGLKFPDLGFLNALPALRAAEFVETVFSSSKGIEGLNRLEQVSSWLD